MITSSELKKLNNSAFEASTDLAVSNERKSMYIVLIHIKELERRKYYLEKAYPSLFKYLVSKYKYSASSAVRRIEAARLLNEVPDLSEMVQEGSVNLTQIGELSRAIQEKKKTDAIFITTEDKEKLLGKILNKSVQETQQILAKELNIPAQQQTIQRVQQDESVRVEWTIPKEVYEKLMACRDKNAHHFQSQNMKASLIDVIQLLADRELSENKTKAKRKKTGGRNDHFESAKTQTSEADKEILKKSNAAVHRGAENMTQSSTVTVPQGARKSVTPKMRDAVIERDQCCQFVDKVTGKRCESKFALEADHVHPRWQNGKHHLDNLQLLCAAHNKFRYKKQNNQTRL